MTTTTIASATLDLERQYAQPLDSEPEHVEEAILAEAKRILMRRLAAPIARGMTDALTSPGLVREYLRMELAEEECEWFCVLWLDTARRVIAFDRMFRGTVDSASVYPREVAKVALAHNAAACILAHNHPSGGTTAPSDGDRRITRKLQDALGMFEIRVLDHFIVSGGLKPLSFAEAGLL